MNIHQKYFQAIKNRDVQLFIKIHKGYKGLMYACALENTHKEETSLIYAASCGNTEIVKILALDGMDVNKLINGLQYSALRLAASNGHAKTCKILIALGADVGTGIDSCWTALCRAAAQGHREVCRVIIESVRVEKRCDHAIREALGRTELGWWEQEDQDKEPNKTTIRKKSETAVLLNAYIA